MRDCFQRLPYFPHQAQAELAKYSLLVCIDARRPVAMFGYECVLTTQLKVSVPELQVHCWYLLLSETRDHA